MLKKVPVACFKLLSENLPKVTEYTHHRTEISTRNLQHTKTSAWALCHGGEKQPKSSNVHVLGSLSSPALPVVRIIHKPYTSPKTKGIRFALHLLSSLDTVLWPQSLLPCLERSGCCLSYVFPKVWQFNSSAPRLQTRNMLIMLYLCFQTDDSCKHRRWRQLWKGHLVLLAAWRGQDAGWWVGDVL
jgi:hypothetical protein